jgi:hypothetical protein
MPSFSKRFGGGRNLSAGIREVESRDRNWELDVPQDYVPVVRYMDALACLVNVDLRVIAVVEDSNVALQHQLGDVFFRFQNRPRTISAARFEQGGQSLQSARYPHERKERI